MFRTTASIDNDQSSMITTINVTDIERKITKQNGDRHEIMIKNRLIDFVNSLYIHQKGFSLEDIFSQNQYEDIMFTIIHISLSFVSKLTVNQPVPAMFYNTYSQSIPHEYMVFTPAKCNNQDMTITDLPKIACNVDRESILHLLRSKSAIHYKEDENDILISTLYDNISCESEEQMLDQISEKEALQYLFLYIIIEHAFVHLYIHLNENEKKNALSMIDHSVYFALGKGIASKLLMSTFRYKIEQDNSVVGKHIPMYKIQN
ncbi:occlusion-derived envelope protein e27 [Neodiprion sertifer nucleopolyhedrovirus]|uniref:Occlusion-derived envelope protein e27 n=1 Tax=Neodiprion sertifer nucleopolyhedrovirus TaxID=111874 RepID=Q6JK94_9CBAC|nr:occlusion-derived envelope protein e27 [Neodiprion sertifer nucleopolyhedrovirus]AAQ96443.1 occlusion-derived envelope protein e27 [Neodiprion sertifer nucleopolyhedrovirus]